MFDQLWEESPTIQKMRAEYRMKGLQEGRQEGRQQGRQEEIQSELQKLQQTLTKVVRATYPEFVDLAQQQASQIDNTDRFHFLIEHIVSAPNADTVRSLLESKTM